MAYSVNKSRFLDIINRACEQLEIISCKDLKKNFSLMKIVLDKAKELGIENLSCLKNKNAFEKLDALWQQKFPDVDNSFKKQI